MDKNTKQALRKAKRGLRNTVSLSGAISNIAVAPLALIVISRDHNGGAQNEQGDYDLIGSGGDDELGWVCGKGGGDRLGSGNGDGLGCGGSKGLGPSSGGRRRLGGSDRLSGGQIGYSSDHLECDGSEKLRCTGSNQLGSGSDNHIRLRCEGLKWAGDRTIDGGGQGTFAICLGGVRNFAWQQFPSYSVLKKIKLKLFNINFL
jgi:hypothetical protein